MELHHFEYFIKLSETEHMSEAAEALNVSQPALSRALAKIESEVGVALFDRRGRNLFINQYGKEFLKAAEKVMYDYRSVKMKINEMAGVESGTITLGFLHTVGSTYLPGFMHDFQLKYPNVQVKLVQNNSKVLNDLMLKGLIDVAVTIMIDTIEPLTFEPLIEEILYVTVPKTHRFATRDKVSVVELCDEAFILLKSGFVLRKLVDQLLLEENIIPEVAFEGEEIPTIASFVAADLGITIIPKLFNFDMSDIVQIRIDRKVQPVRTLGMSWNVDVVDTKIKQSMKQALVEYFAST
ncbi:LysR family transcriptional regulator [Macrococcus sp. EM39E]|uniref:LysR family transcriptional regulator n=1 Tax=Macrococcus animalis TaxID=3395467 RepID=UPI0039BEC412